MEVKSFNAENSNQDQQLGVSNRDILIQQLKGIGSDMPTTQDEEEKALSNRDLLIDSLLKRQSLQMMHPANIAQIEALQAEIAEIHAEMNPYIEELEVKLKDSSNYHDLVKNPFNPIQGINPFDMRNNMSNEERASSVESLEQGVKAPPGFGVKDEVLLRELKKERKKRTSIANKKIKFINENHTPDFPLDLDAELSIPSLLLMSGEEEDKEFVDKYKSARTKAAFLSGDDKVQFYKNLGFDVYEGERGVITLEHGGVQFAVDNKFNKNIYDVGDAAGGVLPLVGNVAGAVVGSTNLAHPIASSVALGSVAEGGVQAIQNSIARNWLDIDKEAGAERDRLMTKEIFRDARNTTIIAAVADSLTAGFARGATKGSRFKKSLQANKGKDDLSEVYQLEHAKQEVERQIKDEFGKDLIDLTVAEQSQLLSFVTLQQLLKNLPVGLADSKFVKRSKDLLVQNSELNDFFRKVNHATPDSVGLMDDALVTGKKANAKFKNFSKQAQDIDVKRAARAEREARIYQNSAFKETVANELGGSVDNLNKFMHVTPMNKIDKANASTHMLDSFQNVFKISKKHTDELYAASRKEIGHGEKVVSVEPLIKFLDNLKETDAIGYKYLMSQVSDSINIKEVKKATKSLGVHLGDDPFGPVVKPKVEIELIPFDQAKNLRQTLHELSKSGAAPDGKTIQKGVFRKAAATVNESMDNFLSGNKNVDYTDYVNKLKEAQKVYKEVLTPLYQDEKISKFLMRKGDTKEAFDNQANEFYNALTQGNGDRTSLRHIMNMVSRPSIASPTTQTMGSDIKELVRRQVASSFMHKAHVTGKNIGISNTSLLDVDALRRAGKGLSKDDFELIFPGSNKDIFDKTLDQLEKNIGGVKGAMDATFDSKVLNDIIDLSVPIDKAITKAVSMQNKVKSEYFDTISKHLRNGDFKALNAEDPKKFVDLIIGDIANIPNDVFEKRFGEILHRLPDDFKDRFLYDLKTKIANDNRRKFNSDTIPLMKLYDNPDAIAPTDVTKMYNDVFSNPNLVKNLSFAMGDDQFDLFKNINAVNLITDLTGAQDVGNSVARTAVMTSLFDNVRSAANALVDQKKLQFLGAYFLNSELISKGVENILKAKKAVPLSRAELLKFLVTEQGMRHAAYAGLSPEDFADIAYAVGFGSVSDKSSPPATQPSSPDLP